jgi:transcriptional regulator with XRE-family HTH domain
MPNHLRAARIAAGLTQDELAERAGTSKVQISRLERGDRRLTVDWLERIGNALGVDPHSLWSDDPPALPVTTLLRQLRQRAGLSMAAIASMTGLARASSWQRYEDQALFSKSCLPLEMRSGLLKALAGRGDPPITEEEVDRLFGADDAWLAAPRPLTLIISPEAVAEAERYVALASPINAAPKDIVRHLFVNILGLAVESSDASQN